MGTVDLSLEISRLLCYGLQKGLLAPEDAAYSANRILALLGISEFEWKPVEEKLRFPAEPLERICDWAAEQSLIDPDTLDGRDLFDTEVMNCLMPRPPRWFQSFTDCMKGIKRLPPITIMG